MRSRRLSEGLVMSIDEEVLRKAVDVWGINVQMQQAQEGLAELIVAISHYKRNPGVESLNELLDGIADAEIMVGQLEVIVGSEKVAEKRDNKIERLRAWLAKAGGIYEK